MLVHMALAFVMEAVNQLWISNGFGKKTGLQSLQDINQAFF